MTDRIATLEDMQGAYSDLYKDVYGFRPRGGNIWDNYEALGKEITYLEAELGHVIEREKAEQVVAVAAFEQRVTETIATGAGSREDAIRWIAQGVGYSDPDFICHEYGLPYGYLGKEYLYKESVDAE
jgi:hypothetical protein